MPPCTGRLHEPASYSGEFTPLLLIGSRWKGPLAATATRSLFLALLWRAVARVMVIMLCAKVRAGMTYFVMAIVLARSPLRRGNRADMIAVQWRLPCRTVWMLMWGCHQWPMWVYCPPRRTI